MLYFSVTRFRVKLGIIRNSEFQVYNNSSVNNYNKSETLESAVTLLSGLEDHIDKEKKVIEQIQGTGVYKTSKFRIFKNFEPGEGRMSEQSETFEKIAEGVNALFDRMKCDRSLVTRSLGKSTTVDAENILDFLLCVENQSNFLIRVYLASQEDAGKVQ